MAVRSYAPDALGDFLRACRNRTSPEVIGLEQTRDRRVPGLRREEIAAFAGLSVDYYTRLEQGRETHPSIQTVSALARLFRLNRDQRLHLGRLAGVVPAVPFEEIRSEASPALVDLVNSWPSTPAIVFNAAYDPLARNDLGSALFRPFGAANLALSVFLDPAARDFYVDWPHTARATAGSLRHSTGACPEDPRLRHILEVLLRSSVEFATLWADHTVTGKTSLDKSFAHPDVGRVDLVMQAFDVRAAPGQELIVYHAQPNSPSSHALRTLRLSSARDPLTAHR